MSSQIEKNDKELAAWNEWKQVCQIMKCSTENSATLVDRMYKSSRKALEKLLSVSNPNWEDEFTKEGWGQEIGRCFDAYIREGVENEKKKNYKDFIWLKIEEGNDPPLKIIRGQLTASKSVLSNVLEKFVKEKGLVVGVKDHYSTSSSSLNEKIEDEEDSVEKIDTLHFVPASLPDIPEEEKVEFAHCFKEMFSSSECVILLAHLKRIALTDPIVKMATGVKKSRASEIRNDLLERMVLLGDEIRPLASEYGWTAVKDMVVDILKKQIKAEKSLSEFLSRVEGK
jgi:hypothetical protein